MSGYDDWRLANTENFSPGEFFDQVVKTFEDDPDWAESQAELLGKWKE
jgi:hypothetical protein